MKIAFTALVLALGAASFAAPFTNGSFEPRPNAGYGEVGTGGTSVAGWVGTRSGFEWFDPNIYGLGAADTGAAIVDVANFVYSDGGIAQTFDTIAGRRYVLDFAASTSNYAGRDGTGVLGVSVAGVNQQIGLVNNQSAIVWSHYTLSFVATGSSTTLEFYNTQDAYTHFAFVDSVNVAAVPGPLAALPFALGLLRRRRKA